MIATVALPFLRDPQTINPCLIRDPRDKSGTKYYYCTDNSLWARKVSNNVLSTRAWVLQETLLAPRTLNFTSDQLSWECQTMRANEVEPHGRLPSRPSMGLNLSNDFQSWSSPCSTPSWSWASVSEYVTFGYADEVFDEVKVIEASITPVADHLGQVTGGLIRLVGRLFHASPTVL